MANTGSEQPSTTIYISQGSTLEGVPPGQGESKLWMLVFTLRECIYKYPLGTTGEEWEEWVKHMHVLTVSHEPLSRLGHMLTGNPQ